MAETAAPTTSDAGGGSSAPAKGSPSLELSKPVGKKDDELWQKHFGPDAVDKHRAESKSKSEKRATGKPDSKSSAMSSSEPSKGKESPAARSSKDSSTTTSKPSETSTKPKKDSPESSTTKPPESKAAKGKEAPNAEPPPKTTEAEPDEGPANDTARARKLFEQAEAAEDRAEARRLYKKAMREAFGKVPPEFDDSQYGAVRKKWADRDAALKAQEQKNEARIQEAVRTLEPAAIVMRKLNDAGLGTLTMPMVERAVDVMRALRGIEDGDFTQLSEVVSKATGKSHDEAMKLFVNRVKVSPEGRAARLAAEQAQREAQETRAQLQQLQRQLQEQAEQKKTEATEAERRQAVEQRRAEYLDDIESELDGHAVLKLPRGKERVLAYLIKTADKALKAPKYTFEQAADRIVAHEKRRLQSLRVLDDGEEPAAATETKERPASRVRTVPRSESRDAGVREESPDAAFDRIFQKHAATGRRR